MIRCFNFIMFSLAYCSTKMLLYFGTFVFNIKLMSLMVFLIPESKNKMAESEREHILPADEDRRHSNSVMDSRKLFFGFLIVIGIAISWVGSTQFSQSTYSATFFAPLFNVWFSTTWMIICYPVFQVGVWIIRPWPTMTTKDVFM